jgi:hypothetical protein
MFGINMNIGSLELLINIAKYFGVGNITITKQSATFRVTNFYHIWHIIIPHFLMYPLSGRKFLVFKIFTICCSLMLPFHNKTLPFSIVYTIIFLSYLMNEGSKRKFKDLQSILLSLQEKAIIRMNLELTSNFEISKFNDLTLSLNENNKDLYTDNFPSEFNINPDKFSLISQNDIIELPYIIGVFEGDGSFFIRFLNSSKIYSFGFNITTSIEDLPILIKIKIRLGCGKIVIHNT